MRVSRTNGDERIPPDHRDAELERLRKERDELRVRARRAEVAKERLARLVSTSRTFASSMRDRGEERRSSRRRLFAQHAVARVLAEGSDLEEAAPKILKILGDGFGWTLGVFWSMDEETGMWRCDEFWRSPGVAAGPFEAACRQASLRRGDGLPGYVWARGGPVWVENVLENKSFLWTEAAAEEGLRAALAFPIRIGGSSDIFEFFGREVLPPDEDLILFATVIGGQIGQFIERQQTEKKLRESEERFRTFFSTAAVGATQADPDTGRFLQVNAGFCRLLGYSEDELLSMTFSQVTHPDDRSQNLEDFTRLLRGDIREYYAEKRCLRRNGQVVWVQLAVSLVRDTDGRPLHTIAVTQDVTERKRAEEALRESEERYKALYEDNPFMYFTVDTLGTVLSVNGSGAKQLGYTVEELVGRPVFDVFHEEDKEDASRNFSACLRDRERTGSWEARKLRKDGSALWIKENMRIVRSSDGGTVVLLLCEDITERKRAEEERERSLSRELQSRAHAEERRRISRELHDRVAHSMAVVHQSLELHEALKEHDAAMAGTKMKLAREMAREALTSTRNLSMELRRPEVRRGLEAALADLLRNIVPPETHSEVYVEGDETLIPPHARGQLFQILREAVRNAVAHSGCDRMAIELDITPERVVGCVEDDGRGFDPDEARSGGGLRSMRERAALVNGALGVSSEPNEGTRVKVSVPLEDA